MSEASKPIFVIGGTGRHGGTGAYVARQLLKLGIPVRSLVRQIDDRARALEELGAEVVVGDLRESARRRNYESPLPCAAC
jgi:uncharacterized protein YbjT (DUF2867 family)